jgi:hypothetical protein
MQKKKKVIVIDPVLETIFGASYRNYQDLYILGGFSMFTCSMVDFNEDKNTGNDLFIDDEGLLKSNQKYFNFTGVGTFAGVGILIGTNHENGESISTTWTVDQVKRAVSFKPEGFRIEPSMTFHVIDEYIKH